MVLRIDPVRPTPTVRCPKAGALFLALLCLGSAWGAERIAGQANTLQGPPTCQECSIERTLLTTIHDTTFDGGAIGDGAAKPHVNSDGTFLVIAGPSLFSREIYVAGRDGAISHLLGRTGEGPGEYQDPMHVMEIDSSFLVVDGALGRITYLQKPSLSTVRTARIPARSPGVAPVGFPDGSYVMWNSVGTREAAGFGLHHVSREGRILRSFGPSSKSDVHALGVSGDSAVWVGFDNYRIEKWSLKGTRLTSVTRLADWVRPDDGSTESGDWVTWLSGLYEDRSGLLWTHTAARKKRPAPAPGVALDPGDVESIVEVLDLSGMRVIAQSRQAGRRDLAVSGSGFFSAGRRNTPEGVVLTEVWAYRLLRSSPVSPHPARR